jgi:hypothetical protein
MEPNSVSKRIFPICEWRSYSSVELCVSNYRKEVHQIPSANCSSLRWIRTLMGFLPSGINSPFSKSDLDWSILTIS